MESFGLPIFTPDLVDGLIDAMLLEQGDLTAVERFSQSFGSGAEGPESPSRVYSSLLPAKPPGPGQQYAFEVDLDRCSGCKACVSACHSMNGLDDGEVWREVGLLISVASLPVLQHVTTACHHCLDPACLNACPVNAYEKDPVTGIVSHLDDQCFGCQYCILACPYDVPKFHAGKGIVRKCDMCSGRLADGEAPACVQGCPHEAIRIRLVDREEVIAVAVSQGFLPTAPDPIFTLPTTRYVSTRPLTAPVRAADDHRNDPEHAHWPLVVMLVLTQASAGGFALDAWARGWGLNVPAELSVLSLILAVVGIHASLLHLGRPLYAFRALIGLRHSWLSREILAFGVFGATASAATAAIRFRPEWELAGWLSTLAASTGAVAVACSVMVYHVVRRPFWHSATSAPKFAGTSLILGLSLALVAMGGVRPIAFALAAATLSKLLLDASVLTHLRDPRPTPLRRTAERLVGALAVPAAARVGFGIVGGIVLPLAVAATSEPGPRLTLAIAALGVSLAGELAERYLFFSAVVRPKMPGGVSA